MTALRCWSQRFCCIGLIAAASLAALAKDKKPPDNPQSDHIFKSRSELVQIPVFVKDRSSKAHMPRLKKDDFSVFEDGKEQKIAIFEEIAGTPLPNQKTSKVKNEYDNIPGPGDRSSVSTILLFDGGGLGWGEFQFVRHRLLKYFRNNAVSVPTKFVLFNGRSFATLQDFTTDSARLAQAVEQVAWLHDNGDAQRLSDDRMRVAIDELKGNPFDIAPRLLGMDHLKPHVGVDELQGNPIDIKLKLPGMEEIKPINGPSFLGDDDCMSEARFLNASLRKLESIAQAYAGIPGRKNLVWLSDSFPHPFHNPTGGACMSYVGDYLPALARLSRLFNEAQIAIYPVSTISNPNVMDRMNALAAQTGGKVYFDYPDNAYAEAVGELGHYYVIGYYRTAPDSTKLWHKLSVQVASKQTIVRAREGFFTDPEPTASEDLFELALARSSPQTFTSLPFRVHIEPSARSSTPDNKMLYYIVGVPPEALTVDASDGNHVKFEITLDVYSDKGERTFNVTKNMEARLKPDSIAKLRKGGLNFSSAVELKKGDYTLRFFVRDALNHRVGSVTAPFTVE